MLHLKAVLQGPWEWCFSAAWEWGGLGNLRSKELGGEWAGRREGPRTTRQQLVKLDHSRLALLWRAPANKMKSAVPLHPVLDLRK